MGLQLASTQPRLPPWGSLQSVYSVPLSEQQALGELGSVSGPTHVQVPPLHMPEMHSVAMLHAEPFATFTRGSWQLPLLHTVEVQLSLSVHGDPSGSFALHAELLHHPEAQSVSAVHAAPGGCGPHVPLTHWSAWQSAAVEHGAPFACGPQVPSTQALAWQTVARVHAAPFGWRPWQVPS